MSSIKLSPTLAYVFLTFSALITACASSDTTRCPETGRVCPAGTHCVSKGTECAVASCGNGLEEPGEECDLGEDRNGNKSANCSATCLTALCGNGRTDFNEVCDHSAGDGGNTCNATCTSDGTCGNGIWDQEQGEECDGKDLPAAFRLFRCSDECTVVRCGNGTFEPEAGEECDPTADDDPTASSQCNADCTKSICGDGKIGPDELCDPGEDKNSACECTKIEGCGNGLADDGEECDPELDGLDTCAPNCTKRRCGNNHIDQIGELSEVCDDGNTIPGDGCSATCDSKELCGNGVVDRDFPPESEADERWETCDDGNRKDGDNCSGDCRISAACGNNQWDPGEEMGCDTGKAASGEEGRTKETKDCNPDCSRNVCGDGFKNQTAGEECEPGSLGETAECNGPRATRPDYTLVECRTARCGDQYVNTAAGETCEPLDDVNAVNDSATCNGENAPAGTACRLVACGDGYVNEAANEACEPSVEDLFDTNTGDSPHCNSAQAPQNVRCQPNVCGDGYVNGAAGEVCDDGRRDTRECNQSDAAKAANLGCKPAICGDGYVNVAAGEQCDGGSLANGEKDWTNCNGPTAPVELRCKTSLCGDGYVHQSECGEADSLSGCNGATAPPGIACSPGRCGDGYVNSQAGERCDPAESDDSPICNGPGARELACQLATCGDGYVNDEAGEACDPGDPSPGASGISNSDESHSTWNACNGPTAAALQCKDRVCGDGFKHPDEECDVGNADTAQCNSPFNAQGQANAANIACTLTECGDGYVNRAAGEECDPGLSAINGQPDWDSCNGPSAGPGIACHLVRCGDGYKHKSECGEAESTLCNGPSAPANVACKTKTCGDGYANAVGGEECDPGNADSTTCNGPTAGSVKCKLSKCGDNYTNTTAGEACDTNKPNGGDTLTCNSSTATGGNKCQIASCGDGYTNTTSLTGTDAVGADKEEACDNGPLDTAACNGQGENSSCQPSECGDGHVNRADGEECDPLAAPRTWDLLNGEDESHLPPQNACNPEGALACKRARCGDGYVNVATLDGQLTPFEDCDPAADVTTWVGYHPPPGFPTTCNGESADLLKCRFSRCGDGIVSPGEECDPGAGEIGGDTAECNGPTADAKACKVPICGDDYANQVIEECDPGEAGESADCTSSCTVSYCGDGIVNPSANEDCDVGKNGQWGHWCNVPPTPIEKDPPTCRFSTCGDGFCNPNTEVCTQAEDTSWRTYVCDEACPD